MTKIVSYTALLYGLSYLEYAIRSVIDAVDEHHIIYSPIGAHGHRTHIPCPETRDELYAAAERGAGAKLHWHDAGEFPYEGAQRDSIHRYAPDADVILVVDADECYEDGLALEAIKFAQIANAQRIRLPFWHLWRSFKRGFMHDPAFPERVIVPNATGGTITMPTTKHVWHAGYAQRPEIVAYKLLTHGHRLEFRRDVNWFDDVFMTNRQYDCHVVGSEWWNCEDMDLSRLPSVLKAHPYAGMEVIGAVINAELPAAELDDH